ncbi:hypothetical protein FNF28_00529 [Cafeteria roenbergensis]|uniref:Uncharacterized protein n=1 Tax=Cafeteria roenbergensis TaxID=33653 RepID=A0A5A8E1D3_CAFRO|nr:hypothetical protein FNF28_00529 [Cafeteria roenbergensis]
MAMADTPGRGATRPRPSAPDLAVAEAMEGIGSPARDGSPRSAESPSSARAGEASAASRGQTQGQFEEEEAEAFDDEIDDAELLLDVGDDPFALDPFSVVGEAGAGAAAGADAGAAGPRLRPPPSRLEEDTVARLRSELERLPVPDYEAELQRTARADEVVLGMLSPDEAAEREAALEDARLREAAREAERFARREAVLAIRQARARADVIVDKAAAASDVRAVEAQALESRAEVEEAIRRAYREARAALAAELSRQRAVVMERVGELAPQPQGSKARAALANQQLAVAWSRVPQPLRLTVHQARGVKDRLPRGRYVLLVTLWDRLGGRPLRWTQMGIGAGAGTCRGIARPAATRPVRHAGRFYDTELDFRGQSIFALSPADADLAPAHTLVMELFLLGGKRSPVDRVVAWTALPCADGDLRPVEGRFRLPLLRGEVDLEVDQYVKMERRWGLDLDAWLGNLYVEVTRLPRDQVGEGGSLVGEYDVEVAYTAVPGVARGRGAPSWSVRPLAAHQSYGLAVSKQETRGIGRGRRLGEASRKSVYLRQELWGDLLPRAGGGAGYCSVSFFVQLFALLVALYVRAHAHYLGQWLFLQANSIPVYELSLTPWALALKYVGSVLPMELEMGVVITGPLFVLLCFAVGCALCLLLFLCLRHIPELVSRFVAFFGLAAILDPAIVFLFDVASVNFGCSDPAIHPACVPDFTSRLCRCFEGDAFKLYYRFLRTEGSGVVGVVLTLFIYAVLMLLAGFLLYAFMLNLHLDGRMLDLYRRIHGPESAFHAPHDLELSARELRWVVERSRRWRSAQGTMRRVAVCQYVLTDPLDPSFEEVTTHLIIYHAALGGLRELYRHFLRQPDGTVVEVFGDMESALGVGGAGNRANEPSPLQKVLLTQAREDPLAVDSFFQGL